MNPWLCLAAAIIVAVAYLLVWAVCAAAADSDDWEEQHLGIRRS